jgi:DNA-binding response OmpR family regulator
MNVRERILVVDDEAEIREVVKLLLEDEGYDVLEAAGGKEALELLDGSVGLVILDVMMPGESGYDVCRAMRRSSNAPVLFLTAKSQDADKAAGLGAGGDDYLAKPFSAVELIARVRALLRRYRVYHGKAEDAREFAAGAVRLDLESGAVRVDGQPVPLTDIEQRLFLCLVRNRGQTMDARTLYEAVWNEAYLLGSAGTVAVHISNLRQKLKDNEGRIIRTVWGKGYRVG